MSCFLCTPTGDPPGRLVVCAPTWFDARKYAATHFNRDPEQVQALALDDDDEHEVDDVELRWVGSDFNRSGSRQLEVRKRTEAGWTEWARL